MTCGFASASHSSRLLLTLSASLFGLVTAGTICAQGPGNEPDGAPVRKELDELQKSVMKKASPERLRAYEQGIEEVRKSGTTDRALKVGDRAPDFELMNAVGKKVKLSELTTSGPVVLTWYRGGWCPYCNIALRGFQKLLPDLRAAGATLVALSPETPDNTLSTAEKNRLDFEVLSDRGNKVAHAYGVSYKVPKVVVEQSKGRLDLAKHNGESSGELPLGATYVVDRGGVIRFAFIDADYRKRAEPSSVLAVLRRLDRRP